MAIPHVQANTVAQAAAQNDLIDAVNTNTSGLDEAQSNLSTAQTNLASVTSRVSTLETRPSGGSNAGAYFGAWTDDNRGVAGVTLQKDVSKKITDLDYIAETPTGCSMRAGTFTANQAGLWMLAISVQYATGTQVRAVFAASGTAATNPTTPRLGLLAGPSMDAQTTSVVTRLQAGATLSIYGSVWQNGANLDVWRSHGNNVTAVWLGP